MARPSPFFYATSHADVDSLAILHLKRDSLIPVKLAETSDEGYAEGAVTNTRFGSFPHKTLIGLEWGSQVRASKVDTGSRGRKGKNKKQEEATPAANGTHPSTTSEKDSKKRKSDGQDSEALASPTKKRKQEEHGEVSAKPLEAGSGFIHVLPPTPESWTSSLDHRTQVVYTPDYSYILQRLRVRPGSTIIEAGAGSGSFTHAASRAVFSGYPAEPAAKRRKTGRVCSYEYHEPRVQTLRQEISDHGLDGVVELTHRDVCNDGFLLADGSSPNTDAIFLDLPAPWTALQHLTRDGPNSPLNPDNPVHLCTFSPCIEQVIATCATLRKLGWAGISMVEVQNRRIDVRRERVGLKEEGLRGVNATASNVDEALERLRRVVPFLLLWQNITDKLDRQDIIPQSQKREQGGVLTKAERLEQIKKEAEERKLYKEGRLVHRTEPEVRTHTSYLVFAVLPRAWSDADEQKAEEEFPLGDVMKGSPVKEKDTASKVNGAAK
ncbi:putative tRNA (1-methyladenosine) methyltransferase catalytic subunit Gcd14 [Septoria linicola]|nr:putative tRNA (1-methyladenosine) methyltransferase catalytic subunit Gcd14 [Septoria linicola]